MSIASCVLDSEHVIILLKLTSPSRSSSLLQGCVLQFFKLAFFNMMEMSDLTSPSVKQRPIIWWLNELKLSTSTIVV